MTIDEMNIILSDVHYRNYTFQAFQKGDIFYLQGRYPEADIITKREEIQYTRKWLLSEHMVKSELVQTALKCALTSAEHSIREHFLYKGERVFGPHFDIEALYEIARAKRLEYRR